MRMRISLLPKILAMAFDRGMPMAKRCDCVEGESEREGTRMQAS